MTNVAPSNEPTAKPKTNFTLPIIIVVVVVAALGYFAMTQKGLDKQLVQEQLDSWIAISKQSNPDVTISYGPMEIQGGMTNRHALISDVRLAVNAQNDAVEADNLQVLLPQVKIQPKSISFDSFEVSVMKGIVAINDMNEKTNITFSEPLTARITKEGSKGAELIHYNLPLVGTWTFLEESGESSVTTSYGEASSFSGVNSVLPNGKGESSLRISSLKMKSAIPTATESDTQDSAESKPAPFALTIASINADSSWVPSTENQGALKFAMALNDIFTNDKEMPYGAITMRIDGDYNGPIEMNNPNIDWTKEKALLELREFSVTAKDAAINLKMSMQTGRGELLPIGEGVLEIKNFAFILDELRKRSGIDEATESLLAILLNETTGQKLEEVKDLSLPIKRVDGGSMQIGNSNFEELFAIVLTGGKIAPNTAPVLDLDAAPLDDAEVKEMFNE